MSVPIIARWSPRGLVSLEDEASQGGTADVQLPVVPRQLSPPAATVALAFHGTRMRRMSRHRLEPGVMLLHPSRSGGSVLGAFQFLIMPCDIVMMSGDNLSQIPDDRRYNPVNPVSPEVIDLLPQHLGPGAPLLQTAPGLGATGIAPPQTERRSHPCGLEGPARVHPALAHVRTSHAHLHLVVTKNSNKDRWVNSTTRSVDYAPISGSEASIL